MEYDIQRIVKDAKGWIRVGIVTYKLKFCGVMGFFQRLHKCMDRSDFVVATGGTTAIVAAIFGIVAIHVLFVAVPYHLDGTK